MTKIFESPDKGETVYVREAGSTERIEIKTSQLRYKLKELQLWHDIRLAAETNQTLQEALNQCIMIYQLSKEYKDV